MLSIFNFYGDQVASGANYLDVVAPEWVSKIDLGSLGMAWPKSCVLGQVFGSYETGLRRLGLDEAYAQGNGFNIGSNGQYIQFVAYPFLKAAWMREIKSRQLGQVPT